ncbi:hypothetical protein [Sporosarcina pasteurii]|uniref:Uncharacterized protein n=1 Tax=Sporosarcina pasteurii TaxID=1474 RepID=A0A380CHV5_SPOPA|nr:hypothetical protein [Sporosarcina pasteurii]MDS9472088.1 hypothetical protein [Sporosarcina pasteurii]SUJ20825.1 Uncharacterised protein [Sporosarcina pasteurii]
MKGRTLVIGIVLFVIIVVGLIYFMMMSTINQIKEEKNEETSMAVIQVVEDRQHVTIE